MSDDFDNPLTILVAEHKKNLEALTRANEISISGLQAVATRQMEFVQKAVSEATQLSMQGAQAQSVPDAIARQADLARQAFDQSISNMRELADLLQKSNREAVDVVNQRIAQSLAELKERMAPPKTPKG
jgi:phasin family protein